MKETAQLVSYLAHELNHAAMHAMHLTLSGVLIDKAECYFPATESERKKLRFLLEKEENRFKGIEYSINNQIINNSLNGKLSSLKKEYDQRNLHFH